MAVPCQFFRILLYKFKYMSIKALLHYATDSQWIYFKNWSIMIRYVTLCNVSLKLVLQSKTGIYFHIAWIYWLLNRNIARHVAGGMLHCAMARKGNFHEILNLMLRRAMHLATKCCVTFWSVARHSFAGKLCRNKIAKQVRHKLHKSLIFIQKLINNSWKNLKEIHV